MDIDRMITTIGEAIDRHMEEMAPWLIGFAVVYFTAHVIVAVLKGWL